MNYENLQKLTGCGQCNFRCKAFDLLNEDDLSLLNKNKSCVNYKPKEVIIKQGSPSSYIIIFSNGIAKTYIEGHNGRNLVLQLVKSTQLLTCVGFYLDKKHYYSIAALTNASACLIDWKIVKQLMKNNDAFSDAINYEIARQSISVVQRLQSLALKNMHGRIAEALLLLSEETFESHKFDILLSRQELADFTALSKESVSRIMKELKEEKIIDFNGNLIEIHNYDSLRRISENG